MCRLEGNSKIRFVVPLQLIHIYPNDGNSTDSKFDSRNILYNRVSRSKSFLMFFFFCFSIIKTMQFTRENIAIGEYFMSSYQAPVVGVGAFEWSYSISSRKWYGKMYNFIVGWPIQSCL